MSETETELDDALESNDNYLDPRDKHDFVVVDVFTPEECAKIIKHCNKKDSLVLATTGNPGEKTNINARNNELAWIDSRDEKTDWVRSRIKEQLLIVNSKKYQFDISWAQTLQFTKYSCGQWYSWHVDSGKGAPSNCRKLSLTVQLSDPKKHEGGELVLLCHGSNYHTVKLDQGQAAIFTSWTPHMVTEVEAAPGCG